MVAMSDEPRKLKIKIDAAPEADDEEIAELCRQLRQELMELDVDAVDQVDTGTVPAGAKGDVLALGTLLVTLAGSGGVLTTLINALQSWLTRHERGTVTMEMDGDKLAMTGISSEQQRLLIKAFISRHKGR